MADPLSQLRSFHMSKREIREHNGYILFGDHGWPASVKTNYLVCTSNRDGKKEYYTLQCLLYFLRHTDISHHFYVKKAAEDHIPAVHRPDRKDLLAYLNGEISTSQNIDKSAAIPSSRIAAADILRVRQDGVAASSASSVGGSSVSQSSQLPSDLKTHVGSRSSGDIGESGQAAAAGKTGPASVDQSAVLQAREEFAASLDEPKLKKAGTVSSQVVVGSIGSNAAGGNASSGDPGSALQAPAAVIAELGPDKVAAMRAKRLAVKRSTIVDTDVTSSSGYDKQNADSTRYKMLIEYDQHSMDKIRMRERVYRTRTSMLQSHTKNFAKSVLPLIQSITKMEEDAMKKGVPSIISATHQHISVLGSQGALSAHDLPKIAPIQQNQQPVQHYNRYDQERFAKSDAAKDFDIDTRRSYAHANLDAFKKTPNLDLQMQQRSAQNIRPNALTPNVGHNGNHIINSRIVTTQSGGARKKPRSSTPIIIIPATTTSLINMYNAKEIIQDLTFVEGKPGTQRASEINIIRRKSDGSLATYKIIDNPIKLEPEDWNRVVAVFVQGPAWQFKGWPWGGNPTEIFSRIKAFHLKFDETKLDTNVANWNVQIIELSRSRRHLDKANLLKFWSALDLAVRQKF